MRQSPVPSSLGRCGALRRAACWLAVGWLGAGSAVKADDWPQFLGPMRTGVSRESIDATWPAAGPRVRWTRPVGAGFAGPAVVGGKVVLHHRVKGEDVLECLEGATGTTIWKSARPSTYRDSFGFDEGPRAVPTVAGGSVYTWGADGVLSRVTLEDGARRWSVEAAKLLGADQGFFGMACSPLVTGGVVIVQVGGRDGAGVVGFEAETGAVRWKATSHEAGYASPVEARLGGKPRVLCFTREGLVVLDPSTGALGASHGWRSRQHASVNAATPLVLGEKVFLTSSYDTGAVLLDLSGAEPKRIWSGDDSLSSHYASVVPREGLLFGFHGRQEQGASLRCIDAATGKVRWTEEGLGSGAILLAADRMVVLTERGELLVAEASAAGFRPTARAQVLGAGIRAQPALADGALFARDPRKLVCLELRAVSSGAR
ncbi:MAG: PQQ-binding-like beta-propeller repeat protein [Verrucomicrobiales bacterium]|nr:PQQ-binding-like beta-propeller repeat protein [Verrucomicrobiales bacterium]